MSRFAAQNLIARIKKSIKIGKIKFSEAEESHRHKPTRFNLGLGLKKPGNSDWKQPSEKKFAHYTG